MNKMSLLLLGFIVGYMVGMIVFGLDERRKK